MKQFLVYLAKLVFLLVIVAVVLDGLYTYVFLQSVNRGKIETVVNSKAQKYDVILLGSSRASNHFVTQMFADKGLKAFNYGMSGGHLYEASLMLKLMIERNYEIKNVILEADLNLQNNTQAERVSAYFLPYIHTSTTIKNHFSSMKEFNKLYYIPFYRYIQYDSKIGLREAFFTAVHKKTASLDHLGYTPLSNDTKGNMEFSLTRLSPLKHSKYYNEIKAICAANDINFIAVMTPMCENLVGISYFDKVKKAYPEIHNYENAVVENQYFSSCGHLNDAGARIFTARIINDFFEKK